MTIAGVDDYLCIPEEYGLLLGGLRWSADGEAVEMIGAGEDAAQTFAMGAEIALLLEGAAEAGRLPYFAHALHMLTLLGCGRPEIEEGSRPTLRCPTLARAFREVGRPLRNAGAFFAALCLDVPGPPDPPEFEAVRTRLLRRSQLVLSFEGAHAPEPSMEAPRFDAQVRERIDEMGIEELRDLLRRGRGSVKEAGREAARLVPPTLGEVLDALESRPRLRGTAALVETLSGAFSLPPRRLTAAGLPIGGYSDVTTRGEMERVLPTQLALDPDEFLRRFASGELLYYEREEPHEPTTRELLLVVDQGPRTWGDVRLVLAAAAIALAKQADHAGLSVRIATTGDGGIAVDPAGVGAEAFGAILEMSDLTTSPALALGRALKGAEAGRPRDVVLLTHPRSLLGEDVREESRGAGDGTRVFALTADAEGGVTLASLQGGGPVTLGRCRVELKTPTEAAKSRTIPGEVPTWRGHVEPVPFPFRIGQMVTVDDRLIAFDDGAKWVIAADPHGFLRAGRFDGSGWEMLPRACLARQPIEQVEAVVGVAGGFVVVGSTLRMRVAAHYAFPSRTCVARPVPATPEATPTAWEYDHERHALVGRNGAEPVVAIDLNGDPTQGGSHSIERAALLAASRRHVEGVVVADTPNWSGVGPYVWLDGELGRVSFRDEAKERFDWEFPDLFRARIVKASLRGGTLALMLEQGGPRHALHLFYAGGRRGRLRMIGEVAVAAGSRHFAISRDGYRVALKSSEREVSFVALDDGPTPRVAIPAGKAHDSLAFLVHPSYLTIQAGRHAHLIRWDQGPLAICRKTGTIAEVEAQGPWPRGGWSPIPIAPSLSETLDASRFRARCDIGRVTVASDRLGQVAICVGDRVIVMFLAFRDRLAAWGVDGTRLGPPDMTGGEPTADAEARLGELLRGAPWGDAG